MKLFSRKHQQPQPVIPPELQPYYGGQLGVWARLKRFALPLAVVVVLVVVGSIIWLIIDRSTTQTDGSKSNYIQAPQNNPSLERSTGSPAKTDASNSTNNSPIILGQ